MFDAYRMSRHIPLPPGLAALHSPALRKALGLDTMALMAAFEKSMMLPIPPDLLGMNRALAAPLQPRIRRWAAANDNG